MPIDDVHLNFNPENLWVLNLCLAIMMFGVALDLKMDDFKSLLYRPKASLIGITSQFIILPALTFLLVLIVQPSPSVALGMIMVAACPGGNVSNMMTHLARGNTALSVSLTAFGTILAIVMTPFNLQIWASLYEPTALILKEVSLDAVGMLKAIVTLAGIPLAIGMVVNHRWPSVARKISRYVKPFSIFIFAGFVALAFASNFQSFMDHIQLVFFIVLLHNAVALSAGFFLGRWGGLPLMDQKTIAIETGIKNSGLALFLIFSFFDGMGGMAIVAAWWGIWHIISGLTLSFYWSKFVSTSTT